MDEARLEALGPETFQRFCQSLLSYEKPDLQALDVGHPDGGRDAFSYDERAGQYGVLQVKFVRASTPVKDPLKWIKGIVKGESAKIERLVDRGATSYLLMTNAVGTPHLDSGAVDKVAAYLAEAIPIPAACWWRNDLLVRLAKHPQLRWGYPDLLSPADILKELVESQLGEDARRRTLAIRAFVARQYEADRMVRFKQVDLHNDLLNLFVDVPATLYSGADRDDPASRELVESISRADPGDSEAMGAAEMFLHPNAQNALDRVVVEGAPGQGKSTLGQYVSQVHRMRLLRKSSALRKVPAEHRRSPTRLPFKVDLRDLAVFLRGEDPFVSEPEWGGLADGWPRSLEGFLASSVRLASGGAKFDVSDLQAVSEVSDLLLVLDGLDEVAEAKDRGLVVDAVRAGCTRLEATALGLQVMVTSRPAPFTNSLTFSDRSFIYMRLSSLTRKLASEYCSNWTAARGLDRADAGEVERTLASQLDQSHIRDLARNPMQLAILLTLILTKGESLPDKRTDLYTSYMNIFFDREAAKSRVVRKHRDTLFALHSYLGWRLHAESEVTSTGGAISAQKLKREVRSYLEREGQDVGLVEQLFRGVVDRIVALVSRVEGKFEFEVQPVREYFAAHYLYSTAQISRLGSERPGTLPERFDGLARSSYWLNVVRFYAGFYNTGELPSLVDRLEALAADEVFATTDRAWVLSATFLNDWSFSLARQSRDRAIALVLTDLGRRHFLSQHPSRPTEESAPLVLPKESGLEELSERCWAFLASGGPADRQAAMLRLLDALPAEQTLPRIRQRLAESEGSERTRWLRLASKLSATASLEPEEVSHLWDDGRDADLGSRAAALVDAGLAGAVEEDEEKSLALVQGLIDGSVTCTGNAEHPSWLGLLGELFVGELRSFRLVRSPAASLRRIPTERLCPTVEQVRRTLLTFFDRDLEPFHYQLPWDSLVEECRSRWGDGWGLTSLCLTLAGKEIQEQPGRRVELADPSVPLMRRLRYARSRSHDQSGDWWLEQLDAASSTLDRRTAVVAAGAWLSELPLRQTLPALEKELKAARGASLVELCAGVERMSNSGGSGLAPMLDRETLDSLSLKLTVMLANRDPRTFGRIAFDSRLRGYRGSSKAVLRCCLHAAMTRLLVDEVTDERLLNNVRRAYKAVGDYRADEQRNYYTRFPGNPSLELVRRIVAEADDFPLALVFAAESRCSEAARRSVPPLFSLAKGESWFAESG